MTNDRATVVERFHPTSGRISGLLGLAAAGVVLVLGVVAWDPGRPLGIAIIACLAAILIWAAMLRPALWVTEHDLVMRNMLHTDRVPLAAIDKVAVAQVLAVKVGERRFVSPAIGHSARAIMRAKRGGKTPTSTESYPVFVEERIAFLAQDKRDWLHIEKGSPAQIALAAQARRTYAWPEIAGIAACVVAFVIWLAL
jgi:hypothetical protein